MLSLPKNHDCPWRTEALSLRAELVKTRADLAKLRADDLANHQADLAKIKSDNESALQRLSEELEKLKKALFKPKSEKMPSPDRALLKRGKSKPDPAKAKKKRRQNKKRRKKLPSEEIEHKVPPEQRTCDHCGKERKPLGSGKRTNIFERIAAQLIRLEHIQESIRCNCKKGEIITAPGPARVLDQMTYGPGLIAHLITAKCVDSLPLYRLAKQYQRNGLDLCRSTITDLFQQAGLLLRPLHSRLLKLIAKRSVVQCDDTPIRCQGKVKGGGKSQPGKAYNGRIWAFLGLREGGLEIELIAYVYSKTKTGAVPARILGATSGTLVVDGASNFNATCDSGRTRSGCIAHMRRKFHEALKAAPEGQRALDMILDLYATERKAEDDTRLELRKAESKPVLDDLKLWLDKQKSEHPPQGGMAKAIRYALNQWPTLVKFITDAGIPIDNNASERALRIIALGRKNFLTVGNEEAGKNLACLYSLVTNCLLSRINPEAYLADVLMRVSTQPLSAIDDLLPHNWEPQIE